MAFWGLAVKADKEVAFVPSLERDEKLHLSQVCLAPGAPKNARVTLMIRVGEELERLAVASLREGANESAPLDLVLDEYTEFSVHGSATLHLTGYYMPEFALDGEGGEDEDEDGEGVPRAQILGFDDDGEPIFADAYDSQEDSDYDSEDEDAFDSAAEEFLSDEDDDGEGETIEDVLKQMKQMMDARNKKAAAAALGDPVSGRPKISEIFDDEDVEGSDEEDGSSEEGESESGEDDDDDEEEESESEEEEAAIVEPPAPKGKATPAAPSAAAKKIAAAATKKRKAEEDAAAAAKSQKAKKESVEQSDAAGQVASANKRIRRFANGFEIEDLKKGLPDGKLAKAGKKVFVKYVGKLKNGTVFDRTKGNALFSFRAGVGEVVKGFDRGIEGMRVGDKRRIVIPPQMGYGAAKTGPIPPNSELHFEIEMMDVK